MENTKWLIWSIEHNAWWAPKCRGYVNSKAKAGRYSFDDALHIVSRANSHRGDLFPFEAMIAE